MGKIRDGCSLGMQLPIESNILIDDIRQIVLFKNNGIYTFDEIDEIKRLGILASASGKQSRRKLCKLLPAKAGSFQPDYVEKHKT